jgi:hypothetical protein
LTYAALGASVQNPPARGTPEAFIAPPCITRAPHPAMRIPPRPPWRRSTLTAALACAPLAPLHAQEPASAPASAFAPAPPTASAAAPLGLPGTVDVGASIGVAQTSRWYEVVGEAGTVVDGTAFSAEVRYWPVPWLGLRVQAGRFHGRIRTDVQPGADHPTRQELSGTVYDASVVVRPLALVRVPGPLSTAYAYVGGGGAALDLSGTPDVLFVCPDRDFEEMIPPECLVSPASHGTVEQVTAGVGTDLLSVAGFTVFAEASVHRYRPPFIDETGNEAVFAAMARPGNMAPRPALTARPGQPVSASDVVTRRFVAGVRRTFGARPAAPVPPPAPPPPSPTTGGVVTVATVEPGAEVYLVPRTVLEDDPGLRCRLRPQLGTGSYYRGRTTGAQPLRVPAGPRAWVLVVRQQVAGGAGRIWHVHEQRIQLAGGSTVPVQLNMQRDGRPPQPCPR